MDAYPDKYRYDANFFLIYAFKIDLFTLMQSSFKKLHQCRVKPKLELD